MKFAAYIEDLNEFYFVFFLPDNLFFLFMKMQKFPEQFSGTIGMLVSTKNHS